VTSPPGATLGALVASRVSGSPQILRRTPPAGRGPIDRLKLCMQYEGTATVAQDGYERCAGPGQMVLYDTGRPYTLRLDGQWSCVVLAFPRSALSLPDSVVRQAMRHAHPFDAGPGAVLAGFVAAVLAQQTAIGSSAGRLGEAAFHLIAGALGTTRPDCGEDPSDVQRRRVLRYVREHLPVPDLTHDGIAAAHRMAPRSLHRLFKDEPHTVTEYIRLRRLEAVRQDLADPLLSHLSIARIAARWCFTSQAHFTRAFQARYGMSPSAARRAATLNAA
jgi:AraC-like DNA-binding protein